MAGRVFLSYGREDKAVARRVAECLDRVGYSVWWDPEIRVGAAYARAIAAALAESDCVVVLWSEHSIDSDWVQAEADKGWRRGILVPVVIDAVEPPMPFGRLETLDLVGWARRDEPAGFEVLLQAVETFSAPLDPVSRWLDAVSTGDDAELLPLGPQPSWVADVAFATETGAVTAGGDGVLRSWDAITGASMGAAVGHVGPIWCCAARAGVVATGGADRSVRLWRWPSLEPLGVLEGHGGWVLGCAISPDGSRVASASRDETVRIWDIATGAERVSLSGHHGPVWSCAYSPDGRSLVSTSDDQTARVWSVREGAAVHVLRGHDAPVMAAVVAAGGDRVFTGGYDGVVRAWRLESGSPEFELAVEEGWVLSLAGSTDGAVLVAGTQHGTITAWDLRSRQRAFERNGHAGPVMGLDFQAGVGLLSGSADKSASILRRRPVSAAK